MELFTLPHTAQEMITKLHHVKRHRGEITELIVFPDMDKSILFSTQVCNLP